MIEPASDTGALNDQIKDAVDQIAATFKGIGPQITDAVAYQTLTHAVAMALHNNVIQQQHDYMLRNAMTTAAASALLDGKREEAEAVLKLADERLGRQQNLSDEIAKIADVLKSIGEQFNRRQDV